MGTFSSFGLNQAYHERYKKKVLSVGKKRVVRNSLNFIFNYTLKNLTLINNQKDPFLQIEG